MPGLVETHFHMWNSLARSISGETPATGYFPTIVKLGKVFTPDDMYQGARLSVVEALHSGITHVRDWCHNVKVPADARGDLRALREIGTARRPSRRHAPFRTFWKYAPLRALLLRASDLITFEQAQRRVGQGSP
jgi:hypothetical protein